MLDIGIWELMVLAVVSLIVIGPKEFPIFLRTVGRTVSKVKGMARQFQDTMDDVATDMEIDKVRKAHKNVSNLSSMDIDTLSDMAQSKPSDTSTSTTIPPSDSTLTPESRNER